MPKKLCEGCRDGAELDFPITMAFQPIINASQGSVFANEALVRSPEGAPASTILDRVSEANKYAFDQKCRVTAIELGSKLGMADQKSLLSINFLPNAIYEPRACIRLTLATALSTGFPLENIIFEFTEVERVDTAHLLNILRAYRSMGFKTAIDDFGSGYAGLGLLAQFQPDIVKLDMDLIRNIDRDKVKQTIVLRTLDMLNDLDVIPVCEGVETIEEFELLRELGVDLMQGYLIARPELESLPEPVYPGVEPICNAPKTEQTG
ncbi:MAG: diguanylate phosphodiesterase [Ponticaulis sp.]|nr:diguanylate phosphodiesterase [Ponticaulis sp.]|tara:strand:- start:193923 stop:194714 length:792 start_codon:yes stop_codon:yes gene_type:complete